MERSKSLDNISSADKKEHSVTLTPRHTIYLKTACSEHCIGSCGTYGAGGDDAHPKRNCPKRSHLWTRLPCKALRIKFFRNSNVFFKGFVLPVSKDRYRTFDKLLEDLTARFRRHVQLAKAISVIVRIEAGKRGRKISDISDFIDGDECVCCCKHEIYSNLDYVRDNTLRRPAVEKSREHNNVKKVSASMECVSLTRQMDVLPSVAVDDETFSMTAITKMLQIPEFLISLLSFDHLIATNKSALVYGTSHRRSGDKYVLKHIRKYTMAEKNSELKIIIQLRGHPNIISVRLTYENPVSVALLMDSMQCDLLTVLKEFGVFSEQKVQFMLRMLARGLAHIHGHSIMHRDIKPENVLVDIDEHGNILHLKIADFGLATEDDGQPVYFRCGTPHYMAPEVVSRAGYNCLVDCWSTGALLYDVMTGTRPFGDELVDINDIYNAIITNDMAYEPLVLQGASIDCIYLISRLLTKTPKCRFTAQQILNDPFITKPLEKSFA